MKNGAASGGGSRPEGDTTHHAAEIFLQDVSSKCTLTHHSRAQQSSVNPQAEAIFWTTELTILSDKDRSRACVPGCLSEKSAISRRSTRSVTQSRAIRSNKIIRSFAILNKA
jgi:hypothetical protein